MSPQNTLLLNALERGEKLTVAKALTTYGCYAFSQRLGELRRMGYPIRSDMIRVGDKHVAQYRLVTE